MDTINHPKVVFLNKTRMVPDVKVLRQNARPQEKMERFKVLEDRMRNHIQKHEALWIGRELSKLMGERHRPENHHPTPYGMARNRVTPGGLAARARINVKARITQRMTRLKRMRNALTQKNSQTKQQTQKHRQAFNETIRPMMKGPKT